MKALISSCKNCVFNTKKGRPDFCKECLPSLEHYSQKVSRPVIRYLTQTLLLDPTKGIQATQIIIIVGNSFLSNLHNGNCYNIRVKWLDKKAGTVKVSFLRLLDNYITLGGPKVHKNFDYEVSLDEFKPLKKGE